jgi:hypothetical protein
MPCIKSRLWMPCNTWIEGLRLTSHLLVLQRWRLEVGEAEKEIWIEHGGTPQHQHCTGQEQDGARKSSQSCICISRWSCMHGFIGNSSLQSVALWYSVHAQPDQLGLVREAMATITTSGNVHVKLNEAYRDELHKTSNGSRSAHSSIPGLCSRRPWNSVPNLVSALPF